MSQYTKLLQQRMMTKAVKRTEGKRKRITMSITPVEEKSRRWIGAAFVNGVRIARRNNRGIRGREVLAERIIVK